MDILNWGHVTPDASNIERNEFIYVYNHDLSSAEKIGRAIRFIVGRLTYYDTQLPKDPFHFINIDIRGQQLTDAVCSKIKEDIVSQYKRPEFLSINIIK